MFPLWMGERGAKGSADTVVGEICLGILHGGCSGILHGGCVFMA